MDRAKIRKALDHFENDQYVDAKDIISQEIAGKRDVFLKDRLGLSNDITVTTPAPDGNQDDVDNDDAGDAGDDE
jgi:hypothetical protein